MAMMSLQDSIAIVKAVNAVANVRGASKVEDRRTVPTGWVYDSANGLTSRLYSESSSTTEIS